MTWGYSWKAGVCFLPTVVVDLTLVTSVSRLASFSHRWGHAHGTGASETQGLSSHFRRHDHAVPLLYPLLLGHHRCLLPGQDAALHPGLLLPAGEHPNLPRPPTPVMSHRLKAGVRTAKACPKFILEPVISTRHCGASKGHWLLISCICTPAQQSLVERFQKNKK